jgi:CelD/BcsL family acetyltransferase involved in cellulose biosynthesis
LPQCFKLACAHPHERTRRKVSSRSERHERAGECRYLVAAEERCLGGRLEEVCEEGAALRLCGHGVRQVVRKLERDLLHRLVAQPRQLGRNPLRQKAPTSVSQ